MTTFRTPTSGALRTLVVAAASAALLARVRRLSAAFTRDCDFGKARSGLEPRARGAAREVRREILLRSLAYE